MDDIEIFSEYLMPDEKILWQGREKYRMFFDLKAFVGTAMIAVAVYNLACYKQSKFSTFFLLLFILFMLYMIFDIPKRIKARAGIYCAVTDIRVIQYNEKTKKFSSCRLKDTDDITVDNYRKDYGSICFSESPKEDTEEYDVEESVMLFDYIDNPKQAADIARKARKELLNSNNYI